MNNFVFFYKLFKSFSKKIRNLMKKNFPPQRKIAILLHVPELSSTTTPNSRVPTKSSLFAVALLLFHC